MHPNPLFRSDDQEMLESLIEETGFAMVFLTTPDGPRVGHTPIISTGGGAVQFHLARSNAMTRHLDGATALAVINGPDGYVSPRWYENRGTVPTWDYVTLELEGQVRRMDDAQLETFLHTLIERHETRLGGQPWQASECPEDVWQALFGGIAGFEMEIQTWRPTIKMSQKKTAKEREQIAAGLSEAGSPALAEFMERLAP